MKNLIHLFQIFISISKNEKYYNMLNLLMLLFTKYNIQFYLKLQKIIHDFNQ